MWICSHPFAVFLTSFARATCPLLSSCSVLSDPSGRLHRVLPLSILHDKRCASRFSTGCLPVLAATHGLELGDSQYHAINNDNCDALPVRVINEGEYFEHAYIVAELRVHGRPVLLVHTRERLYPGSRLRCMGTRV